MNIEDSNFNGRSDQYDSVREYISFFEKIPKYKLFYLRICPKFLSSFQRGRIISLILLIVNQLQELSLLIKVNEQFKSTYENYFESFINALDYVLLRDDSSKSFLSIYNIRTTIFISIIFFNASILLSLFILYGIYSHTQYRAHDISSITLILSIITKTYNYVIAIPSLSISIQFISEEQYQLFQLAAYPNAILTIFLALAFGFHDFDYSYKNQDCLNRRKSKYFMFRIIIWIILIVLETNFSQDILTVISLTYSIGKLIFYHKTQVYTNKIYSIYHQTLNIIYFLFNILLCAYYLLEEDKVFIFLLICLPFSFQISKILHTKMLKQLYYECLGNSDLSLLPFMQVDLYIRQLTRNLLFYFEDYMLNGQAIVFETISINHTLTCKVSDYKCFCFEFRKDQDDNTIKLDEILGQEYRQKYVIFYIVDIFEKYIYHLKKNKLRSSEVMFTYISFLFEVLKISTKSFSELYSFQNKLISNENYFFDLFYTQILLERNDLTFESFFKNSAIQNQRIYIMSAVIFDEKIEVYRKLLSAYLLQIGVFYDYLCQNNLDLLEVEKQATILYQKNHELKSIQQELFDINPADRQLIFLSTIYNSLLDFECRRIADQIKSSKRLPSRQLLPSEKGIDIFVQNSCVVYASFNTIDGKITKVSKSFEQVYDIENKFIIGKTINSLIPRGLYGAHDDLMKNFRNKGTMNVIMKGARMVFGLNGRGFIIPLMIRLKLENIFGEFGVCSHLSRVNADKDYLFFSYEGEIMDISENLYNKAFSSLYPLQQLRLLNINNIIPLSYSITELNQFSIMFYSILVVKGIKDNNKNAYAKQSKSNKTIADIVSDISQDDDIFNISFQMCLIPTSLGTTFKFVEINSLHKETNKQKKLNSIKQLQDCIQVFISMSKKINMTFDQINNNAFHRINTQKDQDEDDDSLDEIFKFIEPPLKMERIQSKRYKDDLKSIPKNNADKSPKNNNNALTPKPILSSNSKQGNHFRFNSLSDAFNSNSNLQQQNISSGNLSPLTITNNFNNNFTILHTNQAENIKLAGKNTKGDQLEHEQNLQQKQKSELLILESQPYISNMKAVEPYIVTKREADLESPLTTLRLQEEIKNFINPYSNDQYPDSPTNVDQQFNSQNQILSPHDDYSQSKKSKFNLVKQQIQDLQFQDQSLQEKQQEGIEFLASQERLLSNSTINQKVISFQNERDGNRDDALPSKEQENSYKGIMQNQKNVIRQTSKALTIKQNMVTSQETLMKYNKVMKNSNILQEEKKEKIILREVNEKGSILKRESGTEKEKEDFINNSTQDFGEEEVVKIQNDGDKRDLQSVRSSSQGMHEVLKKSIVRKIKSQKNTNGLNFFLIAGIISFLALLILNSALYAELDSTQSHFYLNYQIMGIFNYCLFDVQRSISSFMYRIINAEGSLSFPPDLEQSERIIAEKDSINFLKEYQQQFQYLISEKQEQDYKKVFSDIRLNLYLLAFDEKSGLYPRDGEMNVQLIYFFPIYLAQLNKLKLTKDLVDLEELWENYHNFFDYNDVLQNSVENQVWRQFESLISLQQSNLILFFGVALLLSFTLLPLSILIIRYKEKMLKLFGSFSPDKMQRYVDLIEFCINSMEMQILDTGVISKAISHQSSKQKSKEKRNHQEIIKHPLRNHDFSEISNKEVSLVSSNLAVAKTNIMMSDHKKSEQRYSFNLGGNLSNEMTISKPLNEQNLSHLPITSKKNLLSRSNLVQNANNISNSFKEDLHFHQRQLIKRLPEKRNRSIAFFSSLPKVEKVMIFSSILIVISLVVFPIISLYLSSKFKTETTIIINERLALLDASNILFDLQANNYAVWMYASGSLFSEEYISSRLDYHFDNLKDLSGQIQDMVDILNEILSFTDDYEYKKDLFHNFFEMSLKSDACKQQQENINFFDSDIQTLDCYNIMKGIMKRGLIIVYKQTYALLNSFYEMYTDETVEMSDFIEYLNHLSDPINFRQDLNTLIRLTSYATRGLDNFEVNYINSYYDHLVQEQIIIFIISLVLTFLVFSIGWTALYKRFKHSMIKSKKHLTIFSMELIMDNNFFLQHFKSHMTEHD